jgi:Arc/MetJ-type ribon-helix-helix transcriptional regulator
MSKYKRIAGEINGIKEWSPKKETTSINLYTRQKKALKKLVENEVFDSRSEFVRIAIDEKLEREYTKALLTNSDKIYKEIIKANKNKREVD